MRFLFLSSALWVACTPKAPVSSWSDLPETSDQVSIVDPLLLLTEASKDDNPSIRAAALGALINSAERGATEFGPRGLFDPSAWVQQVSAQQLLSKLPSPETQELLVGFIENQRADPFVRGHVAMAIHESNIDDALTASLTQLPYWQHAPLLLALSDHGDEQATVTLQKRLVDQELPLELGFFLDLASSHADVQEALAQAQEHCEPELEVAISITRLKLGDRSANTPLRVILSQDREPLRQLEVLDALRPNLTSDTLPLIRRARSSRNDLLARYAELLIVIYEGTGFSKFKTYLEQGGREQRRLTLTLLLDAVIAHPEERRWARDAAAMASSHLNDTDEAVRFAAVKLLQHTQPDGFLRLLQQALADESKQVRVLSAGALLAAKDD